MRLLHTSDWHLGRSLHREDLLGAQAAFVDHLVETVRAERVDCVLVSGDVYDRALPPVDAVHLFDEALRRLAQLTRVVLIAGNHDSGRRLGFGSGLMDSAGVHVRTDPASVGQPVLVDAPDGAVAIYGIPYLEPELVRAPWELDRRSHTAAVTEAMRRIRADQARRGARSVVLAHAFVTGGAASDSERDISVGGVSQVPAGAFDGADYVALGHLHGRQTMTASVRYSGSPLAYSFSEDRQLKGSWLVDLPSSPGGDDLSAEFVEAPVPRRLARLRGRLDHLLTSDAYARYEDHWVQVILTDRQRPVSAMERLRRRFPHALVLGFEPDGGGRDAGRSWSERVKERSDLDVAKDFVAHVSGAPAVEAERELLHEAFEHSRVRESGA